MMSMTLNKLRGLFPAPITTDQAKDTGMAMVLICLLIAFFAGVRFCYGLAIVLLLVNMIWPGAFKPVAGIWLGFSRLLGSVMSRIILGIIFLVLVLPVGMIRRAMGKDSMRLKIWKKDGASVFRTRDHEFTSEDVQHPY
jgi:hypothetical protein